MRCRILPAITLFLSTIAVAHAEEEEAVKVFKQVSPSVVALESVAGSGTGIIIDKNGTILTNAHVVAVPLPFKCLVDVAKNGKTETVVFQKVKILGVHPKLDLALAKIDPAELGVKLQPATINRAEAVTGQRVYAIGNPGNRARVKLTKTVTSGLLSGVDREIDEVSYLQISAPINPGNSGGPLCDKAGKVIGVVTLKLSDVENVGFALPIQEIKPEEFKPMRERVTSPEKAGKYIDSANKLIVELNRLRARKQAKTDQAEFLRALAIQLMHEALLLDSSNGTVYSAIGELLDEFEDYDSAEAYFLAGLEAAPWGRDPRIYRAYGMHMIRCKKPDDAMTIWWEGAAKHPHLAGHIWEDLAISYKNRGDWFQAGRCASAVTIVKSPDSRQDLANAMVTQAASKLTDPAERAKLMAEMFQMKNEIVRRMVHRNVLLQQQRGVATPAFAELLATKGWKLPDDAGKALPAKVKGYEQLLTDLVKAAQPDKPGLGVAWKSDAGVMTSPAKGISRLDASIESPPEEYDVVIEAERLAGTGELILGLPVHGETAMIAIDFAGTKSGFGGLRTPMHEEPVLPAKLPVCLAIYVRKGGVKVRANEREILSIDQEKTLPAVSAKWRGESPASWFLGSQDSSFAVYAWSFVKMTSKVESVEVPSSDPTASPTSVPTLVSKPSQPNKPAFESGVLGIHEIAKLPDTKWGMKCLAISPNGNLVAGGKPDNALWMFDIEKNAKVSDSGRLDDMGAISVVAFTPQGDRLLAGGQQGKITIWKVNDGALAVDRSYVGHGKEVTTLQISADGKFVLSGARDERLRYWELATSKELFAWDGYKSGPKAVWLKPDGQEALATDGLVLSRINLHDGATKVIIPKLSSHTAQSAAFSPDGEIVAVTDGRKVLRWRTNDGQALPAIDATEMVWSVQFSPNGKQIITGCRSQFSIWDADTSKPIDQVQVGKDLYVRAIAISSDGQRFAAIPDSAGQTLQVFQTTTQK